MKKKGGLARCPQPVTFQNLSPSQRQARENSPF